MTKSVDQELYEQFFCEFLKFGDERCLDYADKERTGLPHSHAASLQSLEAFFRHLKGWWDPSWFVFDGGAGASSWMLRHWFQPEKVITADPDVEYMAQVKACCESFGVGGGRWLGPNDEWPHVQATFWDYGTWHRVADFPRIFNRTRSTIYVDDADTRPESAPLRNFLKEFCEALGISEEPSWIDIKEAEDKHGRWGVMLIK